MTSTPPRNSRRAALLIAIAAVGGAAVGWVSATFVTRDYSADWVGATGTWFGSIATVLTLLWAVNVFLGDAAR